jgi:hypothetical protein
MRRIHITGPPSKISEIGSDATPLQAEVGGPRKATANAARSDTNCGRTSSHLRSPSKPPPPPAASSTRSSPAWPPPCRATSAKVVLLGDPAQLKAIGAGDAYRGAETPPGGRAEVALAGLAAVAGAAAIGDCLRQLGEALRGADPLTRGWRARAAWPRSRARRRRRRCSF